MTDPLDWESIEGLWATFLARRLLRASLTLTPRDEKDAVLDDAVAVATAEPVVLRHLLSHLSGLGMLLAVDPDPRMSVREAIEAVIELDEAREREEGHPTVPRRYTAAENAASAAQRMAFDAATREKPILITPGASASQEVQADWLDKLLARMTPEERERYARLLNEAEAG